MADSADKNKRRVKNPETFRERAIKAAEAEDNARPTLLGRVFKSVFKALANAVKAFFGLPIWRPFRRPLRLIGKILLPTYFRSSWQELKLVKWPNWRESRSLTFAVLVFAIVFGAVVALVDFGLDHLFKNILLK